MAKGSKKNSKGKDAPKRPAELLPRKLDYTSQFARSWERYNKAGRYDLSQIREVCQYLVWRMPLPAQYRDHELAGKPWMGHRELHLDGDFLLVYQRNEEKNLIMLIDIGTHSELFG
ncbi:type II toxin-antitoxin system YafQ family toxin [Chimaeribacter californicus]|uniref:Type II toxin-antitoxin system YafQ family toxin n=1 Tax=Chimaeribacter californicus TaxID=2060067 RepID=A0A2N5E4I1_9GAMM|nr:type II toxin-antitoxin system YafQ family toxin [Chimaeribacter californicus]PLR35876.1 type II toxin-antitoxin system YafQ family toxin [Chimaeribacter californicus]